MIRMIPSMSPGSAKAYFDAALSKGDYYIEKQELQGRFHGRLAERLGLAGPANREDFGKLADNKNPATGKALTPRNKQNRVTGYDINFHCPKSVSTLHALAKDDHILNAFQQSVLETMTDMEADAKTRIRKGAKDKDRTTGELIWAEFTHQTSRPVEGALPDPHLHSHCFVFNATWDKEEQRIKAAKLKDIMQEIPYHHARFHKRLADRLVELGYQVRRTDKSFEVMGVPKNVIDLFSKRTREIEKTAKEKGITDAKALDRLGAQTRGKKQKGHSMEELKADWKRQIRELGEDGESGNQVVHRMPEKNLPKDKNPAKDKAAHQDCIDHAVRHCFERASVVNERRLLEHATKHACGKPDITLENLTRQLKEDTRILRVKEGERQLCTTKGVLLEEKRMVELAQQGKGKVAPLYRTIPELNLNEQQTAAVQHVLTTTDRVSIIRGAAGTGKTRLMTDAVRLMQQSGKEVFVVAPSSQASRGVLRDEGFANAETVAGFLVNEPLHDKLQGQVLWVDEAGLLGTKDMKDLLEIVTKKNARLVLGGDTRQHASVVRGDALRILNTVGGIKAAEISKIVRQKKDVRYREAVEDLSKGNVAGGFQKLEKMDAIIDVGMENPDKLLVNDYMDALKRRKEALIISPTHKQGESLTKEIRERLRQAGKIGKKEISATSLKNLSLTEAEKSDWRNYSKGEVVQFSQNVPGIKRGSRWTIKAVEEDKVQLQSDEGKTALLPVDRARTFDVFEQREIGLSKGDKVLITRNGFDKGDKRLNNGQTLTVASINKAGRIVLKNNKSKSTYTVDKQHGNLTHAHCITSHAAQGKTVDEVFISQPAQTFGATNAKQFYVSVSRGKEAARIYTDDKASLLENALELGDRQSAIELVSKKPGHMDYALDKIRSEPVRATKAEKEKQATIDRTFSRDRDYEPGL